MPPPETPTSPPTASGPGPSPASAGFDLVLLGSGLGVYTLARAFHEEYGVVATVVTKVGIEPMRRSVTSEVRELGAAASDEDLITALLDLAAERGGRRPQLLLANADSLVQLMSDHREQLTEHFVMPILDADTLEQLSDKADFARLCTQNGVATPRTEVVDLGAPREQDWQHPRNDLPFHVVMKAARTADMAGVRIADKKKV